jgi:hypothetical protein
MAKIRRGGAEVSTGRGKPARRLDGQFQISDTPMAILNPVKIVARGNRLILDERPISYGE